MTGAEYVRRGAAEFVGTFTLIFVGAGAALHVNIVVAAFANGLAIAVMVSAVGHISGGHLNPAVTLGFLVTRKIAPALAGFYWAVQLGAAAVAALMLRWVLPPNSLQLGVPAVAPSIDTGKAVAIEAVLTFFLVWVVFATAVDPRGAFKQIAGLAIGLTIVLDILMGGALTGGAMNPARAFGPQLVADSWSDWWVWYLGPGIGGVTAALAFSVLYLRPEPAPASD